MNEEIEKYKNLNNAIKFWAITLFLPLFINLILNSDPIFRFYLKIENEIENPIIKTTVGFIIAYLPSFILVSVAPIQTKKFHEKILDKVEAFFIFIIFSIFLYFPFAIFTLCYVCIFFSRCL